MSEVQLFLGDCLDVLPTIASESVDAVITDPPYPHIKRDYGYWTVEEWWALIVEGVIPEVRRILKPTGSAVFILQPNSEKVGKMRGWLWEFMAWICREWNMVQDVWWWNYTTLPTGVCNPRERGLLRSSLKACVWCGSYNCHRDQDAVLWSEAEGSAYRRTVDKLARRAMPSGQGVGAKARLTAVERGGVTPFNVMPIPRGPGEGQKQRGHGAGTPLKLADWWTRYICPPGGTVLDPFMGSGTMGLAALQNGCNFVGIEKMPGQGYFETAQQRIEQARREGRQLGLGMR